MEFIEDLQKRLLSAAHELMSSYGASTGAISLLADSGDALVLSSARGYSADVIATFERVSFDRPAACIEVASGAGRMANQTGCQISGRDSRVWVR